VKPEITLVIADDHPIFRQGLRQIIERDARLKIVGEAEDGESALETIEAARPQVAIVDVNMPGRDGFEVARAVRERRLPTELIILTMYKDERIFNAALDVGVKGYVLKDSAISEVVGCVKTVAAGETYISPQMSAYLLTRSNRAARLASETPGLAMLTSTERRVLKLVAEHKTSKEIADELCISVRTAEHHRANITEKLELRGRHALVKFAADHRSEL
jgi:DNA-binding NarL/FixJ family response regulator